LKAFVIIPIVIAIIGYVLLFGFEIDFGSATKQEPESRLDIVPRQEAKDLAKQLDYGNIDYKEAVVDRCQKLIEKMDRLLEHRIALAESGDMSKADEIIETMMQHEEATEEFKRTCFR